MTFSPAEAASSGPSDLDRTVSDIAPLARGFARMPAREKAILLGQMVPLAAAAAREMVELSCRHKGIEPSSPVAGEEWLAGPVPLLTTLRSLQASLGDIAAAGRPRLPRGAVTTRPDGRVEVLVAPRGAADALAFSGVRVHARLLEGAREPHVAPMQAAFYQEAEPEGAVSLVLGSGDVAASPALDALHQLFVEGNVVVLKMSPVNAYLGPLYERVFAPLVAAGALRIVHGGADAGAHLARHPLVGHVHLTGSSRTHDLLVWGPPGSERERRKGAGEPVLRKPVSSALGGVDPILVTPFLYATDELWYQARNVATQLVNNASFNCHAGRVLVLPAGWPQRALFLSMIERALAAAPPRPAYFPGAFVRYSGLTEGRERVVRPGGDAPPGCLPWTLLPGLDPGDVDEPLFLTEAFCGILCEVSVGSTDPVEFLAAATGFCNQRLKGTLGATIVIHPLLEERAEVEAALEGALRTLRYGAVALNHWPGLIDMMAVPPWGAHPSGTLADPGSGRGFSHNTRMLGAVEKVILRGPIRAFPKAAVLCDNRRMARVGERLSRYAEKPGMGRALATFAARVRG